jgi:hypothetical protein
MNAIHRLNQGTVAAPFNLSGKWCLKSVRAEYRYRMFQTSLNVAAHDDLSRRAGDRRRFVDGKCQNFDVRMWITLYLMGERSEPNTGIFTMNSLTVLIELHSTGNVGR